MQRDAWKSNTGFLLAAIGSAIGLGNIWRFSYVCHKNGGGSFLVPYLVALLATGIPIMILEFAIGHKFRASAPKAMQRIHVEWEWLGWWPVLFVCFGIDLYYVVIIAWFAIFALYSVRTTFPWEGNSENFFYGEFLNLSDGVFVLGGIQSHILAMTVGIWVLLWVICVRRVDKGVEAACRIFMPILLVLTVVLVIWTMTLEGAREGISQYLNPNWSRLTDVQVWRDAFGQIFFSLSIGFGIMIAYASYLPERANLVRSAFVASFANCGYSVFAGFAVFGALGYMAHVKGVPVEEVVAAGPGLCFVVYPEIISLLPGLNSAFGVLFFMTLVLAGISSAMSILEAFASAVIDKFHWRRTPVVTVTCIAGALGSVVFTSGAGLYWLDIVDHFINNYGLITVGLLECLLIVWYFKIDRLHEHLANTSHSRAFRGWDVAWEWSIKYVAPLSLVLILSWSIYEDLRTPYEEYPVQALILIGVGWVIGSFLLSGFFATLTKRRENGRRKEA